MTAGKREVREGSKKAAASNVVKSTGLVVKANSTGHRNFKGIKVVIQYRCSK